MSTQKRQIEASSLQIGMYVSELDRPWLETPFLFQGFCIRTDDEIEELQRYCEHVIVDFEQSSGFADKMSATAGSSNNPAFVLGKPRRLSLFRRLLNFLLRKKSGPVTTPLPGDFYKDTVSISEELGTAKQIHTKSLDKIAQLLDKIRQHDDIQIPELQAVAGSMVDSVLRNSTALALMVRMQKSDNYIYAHSISSSVWALVFGRHLGLDRESLNALGLGGLLLDVGKTKIPKGLLAKTGKLSSEEIAHLRSHVGLGLEIMYKADGVDNRVVDMIATHHERADGSGYPNEFVGNRIPVFGRIGGIVDSYSAMTRDRPYASAVSSYNAMRELKSLSDLSFQSEMVEQFIQAVGIFPAGTLVELCTGEVGIVIKENRYHRLNPEIAIVLDSQKVRLPDLRVVDLNADSNIRDESPEIWIERGLNPNAYDIDPSEFFL